MDAYGIISGPIYRLDWKKTTFEQGPKMPFPTGTKLFGLTLVDAKPPGVLTPLIVDEFNRLRLLRPPGKLHLEQLRFLRGTETFYETKKTKIEAYRGNDSPAYRVYIPGESFTGTSTETGSTS